MATHTAGGWREGVRPRTALHLDAFIIALAKAFESLATSHDRRPYFEDGLIYSAEHRQFRDSHWNVKFQVTLSTIKVPVA